MVRFEVLGEVRAWRDDEPLDVGPPKQRAVLAVLLLEPRRPVAIPDIVDAVWGDAPPANGANAVQKQIVALRRVLGQEMVTLSDAGYRLDVPKEGLDTETLTALIRAGADARTAGAAEEAERLLAEALNASRSEPLAGLAGPVFESARRRLADQRAHAAELWAAAALGLGRHDDLAGRLPDLIARYPARERLRATYMLALHRCGRQAEALTAYQDARAHLVDEYGVEPGEELRQAQLEVLRAAPAARAEPARPKPDKPRRSPRWPTPKRSRHHVALSLFAAVACVVSFGVITWCVVGVLAALRNSRILAAMSAGYGVLLIYWFVMAQNSPRFAVDLKTATAFAAFILITFGGAFHVGFLMLVPLPRRDRAGR